MATASNPVRPKAREADKPTSQEEREDQITENFMRDHFAAQKKVTIKTREDEWVQIKGYTFIIKGGERVEVPEQVADFLEEMGRI